ncbi:MAG TPA: MFS transporter [Candidatus Stackebrandtia faecavium]|nr:MFS transporter [Candidatus Stackebrandtia faecavium]
MMSQSRTTSNKPPPSSKGDFNSTGPAAAVLMFLLILVAYSVNAMDRQVFPVLLTEVRTEYGFGLPAAGLQSTLFALGMGLTGIPAGMAMRKLSRKHVIIIGTIVFSVATGLTVVSLGFWDMVLWRVLSGVGEALQLVAILTVASHAFPKRRGMAIGSVNMAFAAGSLLGPNLGVAIQSAFGTWRAPLIAFALIGFAAALLVWLAVRSSFTERDAGQQTTTTYVGGATSFFSRNPLILAVITLLFGLIDFGFIGMYASYLRDFLGFTQADAAVAVGLAGLAAFASPLGGILVDRITPRAAIAWLSLAQTACGVALFFGPGNLPWQATWSFLFGLIASSGLYVGLAACLVKSMESSYASRASGLFTSSIYLGAGFAGLVFGMLVDAAGWQAAGMIQIAGLSFICVVLAFALKMSDFSRVAPVSPSKE